MGADLLFAGDRGFLIEESSGGVRLTHVENVRGALYPLFRLMMGGAIPRHHEGFNDSLERRAEAVAGAPARPAS